MIISEDIKIVIYLLIGTVAGSIMFRILTRKRGPIIGAMVIDMRDSSRDICHLVLYKDLKSISENSMVRVRVTNLVGTEKKLQTVDNEPAKYEVKMDKAKE